MGPESWELQNAVSTITPNKHKLYDKNLGFVFYLERGE